MEGEVDHLYLQHQGEEEEEKNKLTKTKQQLQQQQLLLLQPQNATQQIQQKTTERGRGGRNKEENGREGKQGTAKTFLLLPNQNKHTFHPKTKQKQAQDKQGTRQQHSRRTQQIQHPNTTQTQQEEAKQQEITPQVPKRREIHRKIEKSEYASRFPRVLKEGKQKCVILLQQKQGTVARHQENIGNPNLLPPTLESQVLLDDFGFQEEFQIEEEFLHHDLLNLNEGSEQGDQNLLLPDNT